MFLSINLFFSTIIIQGDKKIKENLDPESLKLCEQQAEGYSMKIGCIDENYGVFAHEMYFSGLLFILIFFLFIKPNPKHVFFSPGLMIIWMFLSELILWLFHIPIIWVVPLEGDVGILNNLYFSLNMSTFILILFLLLSFIGGFLGIGLSDLIRKHKKKVPLVQS